MGSVQIFMMEKFVEKVKGLEKKTTLLEHRENNLAQDSSRGRGGRDFKGRGGAETLKEKWHICTAFYAKEMDHMIPLHASDHGTKLSRKETNEKVKLMI